MIKADCTSLRLESKCPRCQANLFTRQVSDDEHAVWCPTEACNTHVSTSTTFEAAILQFMTTAYCPRCHEPLIIHQIEPNYVDMFCPNAKCAAFRAGIGTTLAEAFKNLKSQT